MTNSELSRIYDVNKRDIFYELLSGSDNLTNDKESSKVEDGKGKILDRVSDALALASFIPGADTVTNLLSIFVDLARGDYKSAGLDALGMLPVVGEGADALKVAGKAASFTDMLKLAGTTAGAVKFVDKSADALKIADKAADAVKTADKTVDAARAVDKTADTAKTVEKTLDYSKFPKSIHNGRQGKHIVGHNNYMEGKSIFSGSVSDAQQLIKQYGGTGEGVASNVERVDFKKIIGKYVDIKTGKAYDTTVGTIRYSKDGAHIVPAKPNWWR